MQRIYIYIYIHKYISIFLIGNVLRLKDSRARVPKMISEDIPFRYVSKTQASRPGAPTTI